MPKLSKASMDSFPGLGSAPLADFTPNFSYAAPGGDAAGLRLTLSVFADRADLRLQMREDAEGAGFRIAGAGKLDDLLEGPTMALGDVILLDCPRVDGAALAALARLDMRVARAGASLVVSTSVEALDDVFAVLDQCEPQILVSPTRAERLIALGQVLASMSGQRVRELSEQDRLVLLRLTEQVTQIAERIDRLQAGGPSLPEAGALAGQGAQGASVFRFDLARADAGAEEEALVRPAPLPQPDPRLVRRLIRRRQMRARFFDGDLFADPAWDMLLDLTAARAEQARVSVTSLCIASGVPPTTALRWIGQMTGAGLLQRNEDETDRRRAFITLTDKAADAMARYFVEFEAVASRGI